jgi:sulfite reductase (NADPH) flavoprotein alpha-component
MDGLALSRTSRRLSPGPGAALGGTGATAGGGGRRGKQVPFEATVLARRQLNAPGSEKRTVHLELSLGDTGTRYLPGDALGIWPHNSAEAVGEIFALSRLDADAVVTIDGDQHSLEHALAEVMEIRTVTHSFLTAYGAATGHAEILRMLERGREADFRAYARGREVVDVLREFPPDDLSAQALVDMLRRLRPRLYSIASSQLAHDNEVHLLVGLTRYESHGRLRKGACSSYLSERIDNSHVLRAYLSSNPSFRLPADPDAAVIMVGPGTGVAPFRAFLEEREILGCRGKNWLFFGERHAATDFFYQDEWQRWSRSELLTRLDLAFSRDQMEKIYVQHRMRERGRDLFAWLEQGACLYVCGEGGQMAVGVHEALVDIVARHGGRTREAAVQYLDTLRSSRRYQRDVY